MKIERDFHMMKGDDEFSYAENSRMQKRAILAAKPIVEKAVRDVCIDLHPQSMVIADLGCSFGANTLLFVSEAITTICEDHNNTIKESPMEIQFFLNDLPGNDFNHIFQSLEQFEQSTTQDCTCKGLQPPPHFVAGLPGSFYTRLFPCNSVHLFHSSMSVMWLSQVPEHLDGSMNEGNIHIGATTPPSVAKLYQNQFEKDFSQFLQMRCMEIVPGGRMVLTVAGRKSKDVFNAGGTTTLFELLSQGLHTLVAEGRVAKEKLDSFNIPFYCPSADELKQLVQQCELLDISDIQLLEIDGNAMDDSEQAEDISATHTAGKSMSASLRAAMESLISSHFGEGILEELFTVFARKFTSYIESDVEKSGITSKVRSWYASLASTIDRDFHMMKGDDEFSYAKNSRIQRRAILATRPMVEKAVREICIDLHPQSMVIVDLGCSFGANTLLFVSEVITTICKNRNSALEESTMEVQFFLNDLPGNDFNQIFQSLEQFEQLKKQHCACRGLQPPPYYVAALAGSFYTRLFPSNTVHFFHSSMSVMWLSQVPGNLDGSMNEGNVHIGATTPPMVAKLYQNQFEKDFMQFLRMRCREIVHGGRMVLTVVGRKSKDVFDAGRTTIIFELLSQGLRTLVAEGRVEKEKLDYFNIPIYCPSVDELKQLVWRNNLLDISDVQLFEMDGNPMDDLEPIEGAAAAQATGQSMSATLRAAIESLIASHFGDSILDELFTVFAHNFTSYIESEVEKSTITVITLYLQAKY
uniref:Uncharacterized protein n=1 Tax=Oryza glumipatula TaxID=40148 RepID=A0A0E0BHE6_9ORYZ